MAGTSITTTREPWSSGPEGTARTLDRMARWAHRAALDPQIQTRAAHLPTPTSLRSYLARRIAYRPDPTPEHLTSPELLDDRIRRRGWAAGDCDDIATYGAALALAAGWRARYVVVELAPGGRWSHVWAEARDGWGPWIDLDTLRDAQDVTRARIMTWATVPL